MRYALIGSDIKKNEITLVTHGDERRIGMFTRLLNYWKGPVSVAFFIAADDTEDFKHNLTSILVNRTNIDVHILLRDGVSNTY